MIVTRARPALGQPAPGITPEEYGAYLNAMPCTIVRQEDGRADGMTHLAVVSTPSEDSVEGRSDTFYYVALDDAAKAYNPNQPRGAHGRWTSSGGAGGGAAAAVRPIRGEPPTGYEGVDKDELHEMRDSARQSYEAYARQGSPIANFHRENLEEIEAEGERRGYWKRQALPTPSPQTAVPASRPRRAPKPPPATAPATIAQGEGPGPATREALEGHLARLMGAIAHEDRRVAAGAGTKMGAITGEELSAGRMYSILDDAAAHLGYHVRQSSQTMIDKEVGSAGAGGYCIKPQSTIVLLDSLDTPTKAHHFAHELGHASEPWDHVSEHYGTDIVSRAMSQARVESVAYLVSRHHGIDSSKFSAPYIQSYLMYAGGSPALDNHREWILHTAQQLVGEGRTSPWA